MTNKAQIVSLLTFVIAGIVIIVFFAGYMFFFSQMTTILHAVPASNKINMSSAINGVIDPVNNAMSGLNLISVAILLGLIMGILIEAYYVRKHPILFVVYLFIVALAVVSSIYIANQYETLMNDAVLGGFITANTGGSFIVLNLPMITTLIGFIGLIIMFIAINRDPEYNRGGTI